MHSSKTLAIFYVMCFSGCASNGPIAEVSTQTQTVNIPTAVSCLDNAPKFPAPTPIDLPNASVRQLAAAAAADLEARNTYSKSAQKILDKCSQIPEPRP
jgi:hypothetical protein